MAVHATEWKRPCVFETERKLIEGCRMVVEWAAKGKNEGEVVAALLPENRDGGGSLVGGEEGSFVVNPGNSELQN